MATVIPPRTSDYMYAKPGQFGRKNVVFRSVNDNGPFEHLPWQVKPWKDTSPVLLLTGAGGGGKLLSLDTSVLTTDGWRTMRNIQVGDYVFDERGFPTRVVATSDIETPEVSYELAFDNGERIVACSEHRWLTYCGYARQSEDRYNRCVEKRGGDCSPLPRRMDQSYKRVFPAVRNTDDIANTLLMNCKRPATNHSIRIAQALDLPHKELPIHPYVLGLWLAEGNSNDGSLIISSRDLGDVLERLTEFGVELGVVRKCGDKRCYRVGMLKVATVLGEIGVRGNKHIPNEYMISSYDQRLWLLRGLVDGDGYVDKRGQVNIDLSDYQLICQVQRLVSSLGIKTGSVRYRMAKIDKKEYDSWRFKFTTDLDVATVSYKRNRLSETPMRRTQDWHYIVGCRRVPSVPMKCIQVEAESSLYLVGNTLIPTHNSKLAAEKVHAFLLRYPKTTGLALRKIRSVMSNSTILTIKEVIGKDKRVKHKPSEFRFEYDNGSILAYGGMKDEEQREHIRSIGQNGGVEICWMEEATHFNEEDYNEVLARMRGGNAPWRQVILTTNPEGPAHWINIRLIRGGEASVYYSKFSDNPYVPDDYRKSMESLTGVQYRRLVLGEWVEGSGRVFDTWVDEHNDVTGEDFGGNVVMDADYVPDRGIVIWAVDDGYSGRMDKKTKMFSAKSHPRAVLLCQYRPNGTLAVFGESYKIETLPEVHFREIVASCEINGWPMPEYVVRDRAASTIEAAMDQVGIRRTRHASVPIDESIKEMRAWIAPDQNEMRRAITHPRCFYLRYEMQSYSFDEKNNVIKAHDHGVDALRYLIWNLVYEPAPTVDIATWSWSS